MFPKNSTWKHMGNKMSHPPWNESQPPKDRQFLAFALCEGSRDAPGSVDHVRVVAEWDAGDEVFRPVKVEGEIMTPVTLSILCWTDIPDAPPIT
jgi:hypothetical protein